MKKLLYVIIGLVAVYLILAMIGKSRVVVERKTTINKPVDLIKSKLSDLNFYHQWDPWAEKDPAMQVSFSGEPGAVGHKMEWTSKVDEVGDGSMEIMSFTSDSIIEKLTFKGRGEAIGYFVVNGNNDSATVIWGVEMNTPFFIRPLMMFYNMDESLGAEFEKGLAKLKKLTEEMPDETPVANYEVKELEWPETNFIGSKREIINVADMANFFGKNYQAIGEALGKNKIEPQAAPMALYWSFDEKEMKGDLAAVFKVAPGTKIKGFETYTFPASKVLLVEYYGAYEKSGNAHWAIDTYMKEKGLTQEVAIEEYVTDPGSEPDTAKWLTNIYYMVK